MMRDGATIETLNRLVLTKEQVAQMLQVPVDTVGGLHRTGQLPGFMIGKHLRWTQQGVQEFVEKIQNGEK